MKIAPNKMQTLNLTDEPKNPKEEYEKISRMKGGAHWFYWIAALSLINSAIFLYGGNWSFFAGLAITQLADALVYEMSGATNDFSVVKFIALAIDVMIAGLFALCGVFGSRSQISAFIVGMILYALDGVLILLLGGFLSAGFHLFALIMIFRGLMAARELNSAKLSV